MIKKLLPFLFILLSTGLFAQSFNSIWNTNNISLGSSGINEVTIPTNPTYTTYNYDVNWGDGQSDTGITAAITHTYATPGTYTISISGDFPAIYFNDNGDRNKIIEILQWGSIQWQTMEDAFHGCENLNFDAIDSPDLSQVTSLQNMFRGCSSFNGIVNNWDVSNITNISGTFFDARLFNRPLDNWTTSAITDMSDTFNGASRFNEPLDNWNTGAVTDMARIFRRAGNFNQNINNWNVSNVTDMSGAFEDTGAFNQPLDNWNVSNVTDMNSMFDDSDFNQPIANWNVSNVTNMSGMFRQGEFNQPIGSWDVSSVTDISSMFQRNRTFNQPLNAWNVSNVTNMASVFDGYYWDQVFNYPLGNWDVSNVTDMSYMFRDNSAFNQDISGWDVSNVTNMIGMFSLTDVFNQNISSWDVSNVINMANMFQRAVVFNEPLNSWNMGNVTNVSGMFNGATDFDQPLASWDMSNTTSFQNLFYQATSFNQDLGSWNTASVTNMSSAFREATSFNQNLGVWDISGVTNMTNMLSNSGISQENYDDTLIGWSGQTVNSGINLGSNGLQYCDALNQRQSLIDDDGWNITGDAVNCSYVICTQITMPHASDTATPANSDIRWDPAPNATGYYVTLEVENGGSRNFVTIDGSPANNYDVGNVVGLSFSNEFTAGDTVYVTVVPYNGDGPATGCPEISFTVVESWVNSPDAFKLTYDTRLQEGTDTTPINQLRIQTQSGLTYDYNIDWGDGQYDNNVTGNITHTYLTPGIYTVSIIGTFPGPRHDQSNSDAFKLLTIDQWGTQIWESMNNAFAGCENMEYNAVDIPNLTNVENMSSMFIVCRNFNGNINNWDVSNVTNMYGVFGVASIFNQPLDNWDVGNVTNMNFMFAGTDEFNQNIDSWDVGSVTDFSRMFRQAAVFNQPLNSWNVSSATDMSQMFEYAPAFNQPLNNWNVATVTDMSDMFHNADAFDQNIDVWDVGNVTNMANMFERAIAFDQPLNSWDVSSVNNMQFMFNGASSFNRPIDTWNVSSVATMRSMFSSASSFNQNIDSWNVTNVTTMSYMFSSASTYNQPMNSWDVNSVVDMSGMFRNAVVFNQPLNNWDVSAVANMNSMFEDAVVFNQPISVWDVSSVTLMESMFEDAALYNQPMNNWNVGVVTNFEAMFKNALVFNEPLNAWDTGEALTMEEMFRGALLFNQNIDNWNVSFVTTMEGMFEEAVAYDQTMNSWNVASVTTMENMFKDATTFNSAIHTWNVRRVDTMEEMFSGATSFNQSLNNWRVSGVSNMNYMFDGASAYNQAMDLWNLGNVSMRSTFNDASALNQYLGDWDVRGVTDMEDMLDNTALIRENYDNTLIAWSEQNLTSGITLGAEGLPYCDAQEERQSMIDTFGWTFSLDVRDCPIPECTQLASPLNGEMDVPVNTNITWEAALYAQGYRLTVGTTPSGNDIVNNATIINETSYEFATDFNTSDVVYVTLIPFNDEGDAVGPCTEESFTISSSPATIPECTILTEPLNGANDVLITTDLSWNPISNADGYRLTVGTTTGGNDLVDNEDVGNVITYELATDLPEDSDIFVTLVPYNDQGDATSCSEESFHTEIIPVPPTCTNLTTPINGASDVPIDTPLNWNAISNATGYLVIVGTTSSGIEVVNNVDVGNMTTYDIPDDLLESRTYYVTIIPYNDEGDAIGCTEESFTTGDSTSPPSCTTLVTPANTATGVDPGTNLTWNGLGTATGYKLAVGTSAGASDIFAGDVLNVTTYDLAADLPESTPIFVTVTPYNDNGDAVGCTEESFTTDGPPLCTTLITPASSAMNVPVDTNIEWNASIGADGYKLTVTASTSIANNLTDFDVTAGTTYAFPNDFELGETVTVTIVPYNDLGDAVGPCSSESFTIIPPPVPDCTTLSSPANGTLNVAVNTGLEWNTSTGADGYKLTILASTSTANNVTDLDIASGSTYNFTNDFEQGETVSVTIVPYNDQGDAIGCATESFTIKPVPNCTSLTSPLNGAVDIAMDTNIEWTAIADVDGYKVTVLASNSTENNNTYDISGNIFDLPENFEQGETVEVAIVPYNDVGDAIGCASESFTIKSVPECTNLTFPANGAIDIPVDTNITWNTISDADGYTITVNASSSTSNNGTFDIATGNSYVFINDFMQGETVTVTITPYNEVGNAVGCTSESFTIKTVPTCTSLIAPANGAIDVPVNTNISWNAIADADGYNVTVSASNSTSNNGTFNVTTDNSYAFANDFEQGETVNVTITPYNEVGDALGCTSESFTIKTIPLCTNLVSPADGAVVGSINEITWNAIADADGYRLTVSATNTTSNNETDLVVTGTTHVFPNDFNQGEMVTVTLVPFNEVGDAVGCTSESFTIRPIPPCTALVDILNGATNVSVVTDITWNTSADADGYRISVGTSPDGNDIVNEEDVASLTNYTFSEDLPSETLIYVTVVPYNTSGDAVGCTSNSFETEIIAPSCTSLSSPSNGERDVPLESTLTWEEVENSDGYRISIGTSSGANDIVADLDRGLATSYTHGADFPFNTEIFVSITPYNNAGDAVGCEEQSFTTLIPEDETKYGFSPDGDGINEYWHIDNIEYHPENIVFIYNRWGDLVFQIENYDNASNVFNGEANRMTKLGADRLPSGTYFFRIHVPEENTLKKTQGFVVIKR